MLSRPECTTQDVKAALDDAIASFARRPDLAAALWERLLQAVVVAPGGMDEGPVAHYDITYQLNEIEVGRLAELHACCISMADLSLHMVFWMVLRAGEGGGLHRGAGVRAPAQRAAESFRHVPARPGAAVLALHAVRARGSARPAACPGVQVGLRCSPVASSIHFGWPLTCLHYVRRQQRQKWELAAVSLEHLRLCLQQLNVDALPSSAASPKPPGLIVMLDLLGERVSLCCLTCIDVKPYLRVKLSWVGDTCPNRIVKAAFISEGCVAWARHVSGGGSAETHWQQVSERRCTR